eukprot:scpid78647/ scgid4889/ 
MSTVKNPSTVPPIARPTDSQTIFPAWARIGGMASPDMIRPVVKKIASSYPTLEFPEEKESLVPLAIFVGNGDKTMGIIQNSGHHALCRAQDKISNSPDMHPKKARVTIARSAAIS